MSDRLPRGVKTCAMATSIAYVMLVVVCIAAALGRISGWAIWLAFAVCEIICFMFLAELKEHNNSKQKTR